MVRKPAWLIHSRSCGCWTSRRSISLYDKLNETLLRQNRKIGRLQKTRAGLFQSLNPANHHGPVMASPCTFLVHGSSVSSTSKCLAVLVLNEVVLPLLEQEVNDLVRSDVRITMMCQDYEYKENELGRRRHNILADLDFIQGKLINW